MNNTDITSWTLDQRELATILATAIHRHQTLTYRSPRPPQPAEEPTE